MFPLAIALVIQGDKLALGLSEDAEDEKAHCTSTCEIYLHNGDYTELSNKFLLVWTKK